MIAAELVTTVIATSGNRSARTVLVGKDRAGRTRIEAKDLAGLDVIDHGPRDRALFIEPLRATIAERPIVVQRLGRHRPAMGPRYQPAFAELFEVTADRLRRHAELARQIAHADHGLALETFKDQVLAMCRHHGVLPVGSNDLCNDDTDRGI